MSPVARSGSFVSSLRNASLTMRHSSERIVIIMKREKSIKELKIERPQRAVISEKEALKQMKEFSKRKEQFLATARTGKGRSLRP